MLEQLHEIGLFSKTKKSHFMPVSEAGILRLVISSNWIATDSDLILTIEDLPTQKFVWDIQMLLGFTNLYGWFSRKYAMVTLLRSDPLKKVENSRMSKMVKLR